MATDFNKPVVTDAYATLLPGLVTANKDLARMLEPTLTGTSTNVPTGAVRWNATTIRWERYNGTSWVTLPAAGDNVYAISISGNAATATSATTAATCSGNAATATTAASCSGNAATASAANNGYFTAASSYPKLEIYKPGVAAGQWAINSSGTYVFETTSGDGVATSTLLTLTPSGVLSTSGGYSGNVATATLATKASTLSQGGANGAAMTFNWSGQSGQPAWLWGGSDGANMYVYNPSNFSVAYAASAGNGGVTSVNGQTGAVTVASAPTSAQVGAATAGLGVNEVGTYALLYLLTANTSTVAGSTYSGSSLMAFGAYFTSSSANMVGYTITGYGPTMTGTWRALGTSSFSSGGNFAGGLFLRIA